MAILESHNGYFLWKYIPSMIGAIIFAILFFTVSALHFWRLFKTRSNFCWPFALGCIFEIIGYCGRAGAVNNTGELIPYIIQNLFILVAPALYAASIYMTLGRIMRCVKGEHHSLVRIGWVTKAFVLGDILSFLIQGGSAGLFFSPGTVNIGQDMVVAGLVIQTISFSLFFLTAVIFQLRMNKFPTRASCNLDVPWKGTIHMLYAVSTLILVRSLFRIVEYLQGQNGYSLNHEWTLYIFDSIPMFTVTVVFYLQYPSRLPAPPVGDEESVDIQLGGSVVQHNQTKNRE